MIIGIKQAIQQGFHQKIQELGLEDKLGNPQDWQMVKHKNKDAFKLVLAEIDPGRRIEIQDQLSARGIESKISRKEETVTIKNVNDVLAPKFESI